MTIARDTLMSLEAYARVRKSNQPQAIAHRRLRSVALGEHMTLQFEDEQTIRRQIQETLHIEKVFDEDGIQGEIDVYAALLPDGSNWKATRLIGVEDRLFIEVEGQAREYAIGDEDMARENAEKTSAVHFVRFEFNAAQRQAIRAGAGVKLGGDHTRYPAQVAIAPETLACLAGDLR